MSFGVVSEVVADGYGRVASKLNFKEKGELGLAKLMELGFDVPELTISEKASLLIQLCQSELEKGHALSAARGCLMFLRMLFRSVREL